MKKNVPEFTMKGIDEGVKILVSSCINAVLYFILDLDFQQHTCRSGRGIEIASLVILTTVRAVSRESKVRNVK